MTIVRKSNRIIVLTVLLLSIYPLFNGFAENSKLDLKALAGKWRGEGKYILPFSPISTTIELSANFIHDSANGNLRTFINAEKYLINYNDSGRLVMNQESDTLVWEIWNNFGQHVRYYGKADGNSIHGVRRYGRQIYDLYIDIINDDSINCRLTVKEPNGESSDKAHGYLKRVTNKTE